MKYVYSENFEIKGINLKIEILGCFPGGQRRTINVKDDSYKVLMNGIEMECVTEKNLELLVNASVKEIIDTKPPLIEEQKKKRGRPAKVK